MFTRFNGNVVPFADDSTSTNRTVFGGVTQSDAIDDNLNAEFKKGWEIVGLNDNPTREDFNAMGYTLGALTAYLYEMGISEWNASQNYRANSRVTGSDGKIYKSLTGTTGTPNVGKNPTSDAVNWQLEIITDYSTLTAKTTPIDADLIALGDSTSSFSLKKLTWANIKANLKTYFDTLYLALTGNQTIAGIKTFSSNIVGNITGNSGTATKLTNSSGDWSGSGAIANVVGMLSWKNYGNGHAIFDASDETAPNGVAVNNVNPQSGWVPTYPTLMGWNGAQTYGVRVDSSRYADQLKTARTINGVAFDGSTDITVGDSTAVKLTGDQTIAGVKTFSSSPKVPTPTTGDQAANKAYADTKQANLGFNPVQQGTGIGQLDSNVVKIGWTGHRTKITIDTSDMGNIVMDSNIGVANSSLVKTALNASGNAPIYACRAWVNFNGTGTVAIGASGNVSSITDNGTGDYTVNFTTAMPDAAYAFFGTASTLAQNMICVPHPDSLASYIAGSVRIRTIPPGGLVLDATQISVSIFR